MKILREFFFFGVSFLIISMAACSTDATPTVVETPGGMATPAATGAAGMPESPTEAPHLTLLAQDWLADQLSVPSEDVTLTSVEEAQWTDSCLGLGGPAESCLAAITPGWVMFFTVSGQTYEVRSDQTGQALRLAPGGGATAMPDQPSGNATEVPAGANPLENSQWVLVSLGPPGGDQPPAAGSAVTLGFQPQGQAGGNAGCNSYGGAYTVTGDQIAFQEMVSTMMACADTAIMDQETQFLAALDTAGRYELDGDTLRIYFNDEQGVLVFNRA